MNEKLKEEISNILGELPPEEIKILASILKEEKKYLHRKSLQGTTIIKDVTEIIKERVK